MTILSSTTAQTDAISRAMASVVVYLRKEPSERGLLDSCKAEVDFIEANFHKTESLMDDALEYLERNWNDIIQSDAWQHRVSLFLSSCNEMERNVREFDDCVCENDDEAMGILGDAWIARAYFVMMYNWRRNAAFALEYVGSFAGKSKEVRTPFTGLAAKCRSLFVGVSDKQLEDLAARKIALPSKVKWLAQRNEATLFGQTLGLPCSLMNRSFLICGRGGKPRPLEYGGDSADNKPESYPHWSVMESILTAARKVKNL